MYFSETDTIIPQLSATNVSVTAQPSGNFTDNNSLGNITVLGVSSQISNVTFNGQSLDGGWSWDSGSNVLTFTGLNNFTSSGTWNSDWELRWSLSGDESGSSGSGSSTGTSGSSNQAPRLIQHVELGILLTICSAWWLSK